MDTPLKTAYTGRNVSEIVPEMPSGDVRVSDESLEYWVPWWDKLDPDPDSDQLFHRPRAGLEGRKESRSNCLSRKV